MKTTRSERIVEVYTIGDAAFGILLLTCDRHGKVTATDYQGREPTFEAAWSRAEQIGEVWGARVRFSSDGTEPRRNYGLLALTPADLTAFSTVECP